MPPPPPSSSSSTAPKKAAKPVYGRTFDPWNSSSTGHQRAENALGASTGWRESRNKKLMSQFTGGSGGGKRVSDAVGEGAADWDPKLGAVVTPEARTRARCSVADMLARPGAMRASLGEGTVAAVTATAPLLSASGRNRDSASTCGDIGERAYSSLSTGSSREKTTTTTMMMMATAEERLMEKRRREDEARDEEAKEAKEEKKKPRRLFDGVVVYLNGSTHPLISDHKLKHVLAEHGGSMSSHLGRRKVTHVILGRPAAGAYGSGSGSGGGLAGGKLQREIAKIGGPGVKFVGVQWVLESIKAGKRLPEARFADLKIASKGQQSVYGLYSKHKGGKASAAPDIDEHEPPPSGQA